MKIKFLGTADSAGIPVHNCDCNICNDYRKNSLKNLSTSAYIEFDDESILLLDAGIENISEIFDKKKIEAIFLTHFHADHCLGLLRLRHSKDKINCFHPKDSMGFSDLFKHSHSINFNTLKKFSSTTIKDVDLTSIPLKHSKNTFGYLLEYKNIKIAYLTDCYGIKKKSMQFLKSLKINFAFIDACYDETKNKGNHLNYLQAIDILDELKVEHGYLMHISHTTKEYIIKNNISLKYKYINPGFELIF